MTQLRRLLPWATMAVLVVGALAVGATGDRGPRTTEERVRAIAKEVRCPTCEGLSVAESDAAASRAIRDDIRRRIEAGERAGEIRAYLASRFGRDILLKPEATGVGGLVWGLPVVAGVGALGALAVTFRQRRRQRRLLIQDHAFGVRDPGAEGGGAEGGGARRWRRGQRGWPAWAAVAASAVAAGLLVASSAGERLPGEPAAGSITATGPSETLARARALVGDGRIAEAIELYDEVIASDPRNAEALAYRGWLVRLAGRQAGDAALVDRGLEYVNRAVAADPRYPDARFFKGMILYEDKDDPAAAVPEFRAFLGSNPPADMVPMVEDVLRRALAELPST